MPVGEISADSVPDSGAVSLLKWARGDPGEFFKTYHSKLLPTRGQLDDAERIEDYGQELTGLLSFLRRAVQADGEAETDDT